MDDSTLYVRVSRQVYAYTVSTSCWSQFSDSPTEVCPSAIINNLLTLIGGNHGSITTNQLFSLTGEDGGRRWTKEFPPMPTKQQGSTALCTGTALIVAGGLNSKQLTLLVVEVMNTRTLQWFIIADLPTPLSKAPAAVCGDHFYILGQSNMYTCSVFSLVHPHTSFLVDLKDKILGIWREVAPPPVTQTTCVNIHGRLLAVGGKDSHKKPTTAIYRYNPTTDSWEIISHLIKPQWDCIAAVLPNNQLMVVGGYAGVFETDSVELATIE